LSLHSSDAPQGIDLSRSLFTCTNANQAATCTRNTRPIVSPHHVVNHSSQPGATIHWSSDAPVLNPEQVPHGEPRCSGSMRAPRTKTGGHSTQCASSLSQGRPPLRGSAKAWTQATFAAPSGEQQCQDILGSSGASAMRKRSAVKHDGLNRHRQGAT
jgi:hypothetical protein